MLKTLLHKQIRQMLSSFGKSGKKGKVRGTAGRVGIALLLVYCFFAVGMLFFLISSTLCEPLVQAGLGWLYFALIGLTATGVGVIGSVFSTYSAVYAAKDNELLLSLPIEPKYILLTRLLGTYFLTVVFEAAVLIPAFVSRFIAGASAAIFGVGVVTLLFLPLAALVLSCLLGWGIALIVPRVKRKSLVGTALYLLFFVLYFWGYSKLNAGLQLLLANAESVGKTLSVFAYPFVKLGEGLEGSISAYALFLLVTLALAAVTYRILSVSFLRLATTKRGEVRRSGKETERKIEQSSLEKALLRREWQRFTRSTAYLLNCGLGMLIMPIGCVFVLLKADAIRELFTMLPVLREFAPLLLTGMVCLLCSMDPVSASSISLEANQLAVLKSLPIETNKILSAKLRLHVLVSAPAGVLLTVILGLVMELNAADIVLTAGSVFLFVACHGIFGLWLNLKFPNFSWTTETAAIKQSTSALLGLFGSWGAILLLAAGAYFLRDSISPAKYIYVVIILFAVLYRVFSGWMNKKGTKLFEQL